jgi:hypothetical protein
MLPNPCVHCNVNWLQVLCYDGEGSWTPARAFDMWAPLHITVEASDPETSIKVLKASEDDLHHAGN